MTDFIPDFTTMRDELHSIAVHSNGWLDPDDLTGCCAIAAKWVADFLNAQGITTQVVHNESHFWCRAAGFTIDLTASQFGLDTIYIHPQGEEARHWWYAEPIVVDNFDLDYFAKLNWPDEQKPWTYN